MTDQADPQHIRHGADGTRAVPTTPEAAQAHARIVEAMRDPFAFAVALLGACGGRSGRGNLSKPDIQTPTADPAPRREYRRKQPRTAEEILRSRDALGGFASPLSNRSKRDG